MNKTKKCAKKCPKASVTVAAAPAAGNLNPTRVAMGSLLPVTLGDRVEDRVTGLVGIATARCARLYGPVRICIQPHALDSKVPDEHWADEGSVVVLAPARSVVVQM